MKNILNILAIILLPLYATAYGIANATKMEGYEDMPSLLEFLGIEFEQ